MHTEDPSIHYGPQTQIIKDITAISPNIAQPVLPLALVVETVDLGDLPRFMISADEGDPIGISNFEKQKEEECFDRIEAAVDKVA